MTPSRTVSLAAESLEPRSMLTVTATLAGSDLQISLGAADDVAYLSNDGTNYIVRGTGLSGYAAANASVNAVLVAGTVAENQSFTVAAGVGAVLTDPLSVAASVENTSVVGAIDTLGAVTIGSGAITLAADVTTTGTQDYQGDVGLVGTRTLSAGAGDVAFGGKVDSSARLFADPDAFVAGTTLTNAYSGITLSDAGDFPSDVTSGSSFVPTPTTGGYAPTGNRLFSYSWNAPDNIFKAAFSSPVTSVSLDFAPDDNDDPNAYIEAYDVSGNKVASATYPPAIPELSFVTLTVSAPGIAYILASFDPFGGNTGLIDNLRATSTTTPSAALTVNASGTTTFSGAVGGTAALASLTTDAGGTASLKSVTTTGAQTYNDDVSLKADSVLTTASGDIDFKKTLNGAWNLTIDATGDVFFRGKVGDATPLTGISLVAAESATGSDWIKLDGNSPRRNLSTGAATTIPGTTSSLAPFTNGLTIATNVNTVSFTTAGSVIRGFAGDGIRLLGSSTDSTLAGFTIYGNGSDGIQVDAGDFAGTQIKSNAIGLAGVAFTAAAGSTQITLAGDQTGSLFVGQTIGLLPQAPAPGAVVFRTVATASLTGGNTVVTLSSAVDATTTAGTLSIGNGANGVFLNAASTVAGAIAGLTIGGTEDDGNSIHGNKANGVLVLAGDYTGTVIQGNTIQRNATGILLNPSTGSLTGLAVGGDDAALGNVISGNTADGILVVGGTYTGTTIQHNTVEANGQDGIHLGTGGVASVGRLVVTATGLTGSPLAGAVPAQLSTLGNGFPRYGSIQSIANAGYPGVSLGFVSLGTTVTGTPPTSLPGPGGIGGIDDPGIMYQQTVQHAFETDPSLFTDVFYGVATFDKPSSGTLPNGGAQDAFLFYDYLVGGADVKNLSITGNVISTNASDGIEAESGDHSGTTIAGNTIRDNGDKTSGVGNGILVQGSNLMIGWTADASQANTVANTITGNALNGIEVRGAAATGNTILSNSISLNGGFTQVVGGDTVLVGKGIALTADGNNAQVAPTIHDVVRNSSSGNVYVRLTVPAAGSYVVQLFVNTVADEQGIFPADVNGFQGRTFVGGSPSSSLTPVGSGKPIISGTPVAGNTVTTIEVDAASVAAGDWITATATLLDGTTPTNTSGFSAGVQSVSAQALAVGGDGAVTWAPEYAYQLVNRNELRVFTTNIQAALILHAYRNLDIALAPATAAAGTNIIRTVASAACVGRGVVRLRLKPGAPLPAGSGNLVLAPVSLPAARLYDASTGSVILDVPASRMVTALTDQTIVGGRGAATLAQANAFVSRFQGGLRVASADVDGDGYVDLVTAPGGGGSSLPGGVFGDTPRIITIYNGNPNGIWQSSSINVSGEAGLAAYARGFQVSLANVRPENTGSGNAVAELVVASANKVFVYEISAAARGGKPVINPVAAQPVITTLGTVTGLAAGTFTSPTLADIIVATTTASAAQVTQWLASADASQSLNRPASVTVYSAAANFAPTSTFTLGQNLFNGRRLQNVFISGAALAVGDVDGAPDRKPELILGAQSMGLANIRVLSNSVVAVGNQAAVDAALAGGVNVPSRSATVTINGRQVWQPTGGPDYFTGMSSVPNAVALGANAPLAVAVVKDFGNGSPRASIFAALGATNSTTNVIRRMQWTGSTWAGASTLEGPGSISVLPPPGSMKTRFPLGRGLRLG